MEQTLGITAEPSAGMWWPQGSLTDSPRPVFKIQVRHKTSSRAAEQQWETMISHFVCHMPYMNARGAVWHFLDVSRSAGIKKWSRILTKLCETTPGESIALASPWGLRSFCSLPTSLRAGSLTVTSATNAPF